MNLIAVAIVLCVAVLALQRKIRRRGSSPEELLILSRAGLSQKAGLALVAVSKRRLLIGYGEQGPVLLMDATVPPAPARHRLRDDEVSGEADSRPDQAPGHPEGHLKLHRAAGEKRIASSVTEARPAPRPDASTGPQLATRNAPKAQIRSSREAVTPIERPRARSTHDVTTFDHISSKQL